MQGGAPRAAVLAVGALLALASPALAQPSPAPPTVIDGPSAAISSLGGMSVARDGTGGLVYLKTVAGLPRVFVSRLESGQFQAPQEVDGLLPAGSSEPVIAAGNGGVLLVAFVNSGVLYVVDAPGLASPSGTPDGLASGASSPSLQMNNFGKAYLAFTAVDGAGHDVRAAYYYSGAWAVEGAPLNVAPADDAGTGAGVPQVATAGDGVAIVTWGEGGHVYSRRVWGTAPSVVDEQADVPSVSGCAEVSAGEPQVAAGGDSSYADVAFQERVSCSGLQQTRVLMNRLQGSQYDGVVTTDGLSTPGTSSAEDPDVAMTEYGQGFVTSAGQSSNAVVAMELGNNGAPGTVLQINSLPASAASYPVPGVAGIFSDLIAWQQAPGTAGPAEIRIRYEPRASTLGPELVLSNPASGPTDAARGLAATGDGGGDAVVAWVQGTGASSEIVADQLYQPPAAATVSNTVAYSRSTEPVLSWTPSSSRWGPFTYTVTLDRTQLGQTGAGSLLVPVALRNGSHTWYVTTSNPAGLTAGSRIAKVFVDTVPPVLKVAESGPRRVGSQEVVRLSYHDPAPASGIAKLTIRWGDGTLTHVRPGIHRIVHTYRRAGEYKITVTVADRAGNPKTVIRGIKISKSSTPGKRG
ncbi:MAG TPA: PKD domain-containing protein [Solirubrobacteraceae bacterium]|nr:PKD domain-containing protein [Solirubrobacteraceae bacterium]